MESGDRIWGSGDLGIWDLGSGIWKLDRWFGLTCVAVALHPACTGASRDVQTVTRPLVAAVVRADGVLVPYAAFESGKWIAPDDWSIADRAAAWFADRLDELSTWTLRRPVSLADLMGDPVTVRAVGGPVSVESHCQRVWALPIDLPVSPTPPHQVHRNVGVAFAGDVSPLAVAELDPAVGGDPVLAYLGAHFDAAEAREVAKRTDSAVYEARSAGAAAAKAPLVFSRLHRVGRIERTEIYVFEAVRAYAPVRPRGGRCDDLSVMTGWLAEGPRGAFSLLTSELTMTDCDRKGSPVVHPMAALDVTGSLVVFTVDYHYEDETYSVYVVGPGTVARALSVSGGGC